MGWQGIAELVGPWESKLLRPIAIAEENRVDVLPDVPTLKELGYDVVFSVPRAVVGPPEMPEEAYNYYVEAFKKLNESEKWQKEYIGIFTMSWAWQKATASNSRGKQSL